MKRLVVVSVLILTITLSTSCSREVTPGITDVHSDVSSIDQASVEESEPSEARSEELTFDEQFRNRIDSLSTLDGENILTALSYLNETCKGKPDETKELLTAHFLAWFSDATFYHRGRSVNRFGDIEFDSPDNFDELKNLLEDCAVFVFQNRHSGDAYILPEISRLAELAPDAMTPNSAMFFQKFAKLEEPTHLLWARDGPGTEAEYIVDAITHWENYCMSIQTENGLWAFPYVEGFPSVWTPEGMLQMLRMKLICNERFGLPGAYMFGGEYGLLSETHRKFYRSFIAYHPNWQTSEILTDYLAAMEAGGWDKTDEARQILAKYDLVYSSERDMNTHPIYMQELG